MVKRKALFFLRHYNDIDHIVPVIYKWLSLENAPTDVVITSHPDYLNDYRVQFLRQFDNLQIHFIDQFLSEQGRERKRQMPRMEQIGRLHPVRLGHRIWNRFFARDSSAPPQVLYDAPFVERMLSTVFENVDRGIVVFDWTYTGFVKLVVRAARDRGFITISLPHGDRPHYNRMETLNALDYSCMESYASGAMFDYTVVPNSLCAERYQPYMEPDRLKTLGSPRYNDEWLDVISTLLPAYEAEKGRDKLKIVFFLRNFNYPIFWEEVIRSIKLVLQFPDVYLVVKHHTRSATVQRLIQAYPELNADDVPNLESVYDDVHSGSLLKWADVVLDLGVSVAFEAVKRRKPVLAMEYLHANRSTVAHYMSSCDVKCRDELYDWMQRLSQDGTVGFYDETERQRFIEEIIDVPDQYVLDRYVEFLQSCFSHAIEERSLMVVDNKSTHPPHRSFVGPPGRYDLMAAIQFNLMTILGMRETNTLLDIGCGSLRAGRLFIVYLQPGKYYGVEPEKWLVEEGIKNECGQDLISLKQPSFLFADDWSFTQFGVQFDFLIAQSIFSHASMAQVESCLTNVAECMHRSSVFAANFALGKEDYKGSEWIYPDKARYTPVTILNMIANAGLVAKQTSWFHPTTLTWYLISKPENKVNLVEHTRHINRVYPPVSKSKELDKRLIRGIRKVTKKLVFRR